MRRQNLFLLFLVISLLIVSCKSSDQDDPTVATQTAQSDIEVQISEGVAATLTAMPTPTPVPVDQLSEEQLAQDIETSTNEAVYAVDEAVQYADTASSDGELTQEELDELYYLYYWSIEELEQALYLFDLYYELYDELIDEVVYLLDEIDDELIALLEFSESMIVKLDEYAGLLASGEQIVENYLGDFQSLMENVPAQLDTIKEKVPEWVQGRTTALDELVKQALSVLPDQVASSRLEAVQMVKDYVAGVSGAILDGVFSLEELTAISQLGANAVAGINQFNRGFAGAADMINGLTGNFARGQLPQINAGLGSLQGAIPSIK